VPEPSPPESASGGQKPPEEQQPPLCPVPQAEDREATKEDRRESEWLAVIPADADAGQVFHDFCQFHADEFGRLVRKGIPNALRSRIWALMLDPKAESSPRRATVRHYFRKRVPPVDDTIRADVGRTLSTMSVFSTKDLAESLYVVLRAYVNYDEELGYFPRMGFVAALLLAYMPETPAFWAFRYIMHGERLFMRDWYADDFRDLKKAMVIWASLLETSCPKVFCLCQNLQIDHREYAEDWFFTAFLAIDFPVPCRLRMFDRILAFGTPAMMSLGLAIVKMLKKELLRSDRTRAIELLKDPMLALQQHKWKEIIAKWDTVFIAERDFTRVVQKLGISGFI
jgi:hypothetical protein